MSKTTFKKSSDSSISRGGFPMQTSLDGDSSSLIGQSVRLTTTSRLGNNIRGENGGGGGARGGSFEMSENLPSHYPHHHRNATDMFASVGGTAAACVGAPTTTTTTTTALLSSRNPNHRTSTDHFTYRNSTASGVLQEAQQHKQQNSIVKRRHHHHHHHGRGRRVWGDDDATTTVVVINKSNSRALNERKALKVLIIIFSIFVLFWSPFFVVNLISVYCHRCEFITRELFLIITWLGYGSSTLNPIIYTMFNKSFRRAFINLLRCRTIPLKKHERFLAYRSMRESSRSHKLL